MSTFPTKEKALGMYKKMYTIRKYEESIYYLFLGRDHARQHSPVHRRGSQRRGYAV